jgi:hypothetical protein
VQRYTKTEPRGGTTSGSSLRSSRPVIRYYYLIPELSSLDKENCTANGRAHIHYKKSFNP